MPNPYSTETEELAQQHEAHAQAFLKKVREIFVEALALSPEIHHDIFFKVNELRTDLRRLFNENTDVVERRVKDRASAALGKAISDALRLA